MSEANLARRQREVGFTLMEILIVIAIIGILLSLGIPQYVRGLRQQQLREAASQLQADLSNARSQASRSSIDTSVTLSSVTLTAPQPTYVMAGTTRAGIRTLPNGIKVAPYTASTNTITYDAPYAESSVPGGAEWVLVNSLNEALYIRMIGTTGKVMLSATP